MVKMKVTTEGEQVINLLWDVIAAKGFEKDMYFEQAARDIRGAAEARGHGARQHRADREVHAELLLRRRPSCPTVPRRDDAANDDFLFDQGAARGLGKIQFHDYRQRAFEGVGLCPTSQLLARAGRRASARCSPATPPSEEQRKDIDFLLAVGELFALVVYAQLMLENARRTRTSSAELVDQIFDFLVARLLRRSPSSSTSSRAAARSRSRTACG